MPRLTREQFLETFGAPMTHVPVDGAPPFDFWPYFDTIPVADFQGYDCLEGEVDYAWTDPSGRWMHVLVNSQDANVFMVLILDQTESVVWGHRLLNLKQEYGLE